MSKWWAVFFLLLNSGLAFAKSGKTISCLEGKPQKVRVPLGRVSVLNFPTPPREAVPGGGGFDIKTHQEDLIIKALKPGSSTNLFVYLESRRCFFHLVSAWSGDEILFVRDPHEKTIEVNFDSK